MFPFLSDPCLKRFPCFFSCLNSYIKELLLVVIWKFINSLNFLFPPVLIPDKSRFQAEVGPHCHILSNTDPFGSLWQAWISPSGISTLYFCFTSSMQWAEMELLPSCSSLLMMDGLPGFGFWQERMRFPFNWRCFDSSRSSSHFLSWFFISFSSCFSCLSSDISLLSIVASD